MENCLHCSIAPDLTSPDLTCAAGGAAGSPGRVSSGGADQGPDTVVHHPAASGWCRRLVSPGESLRAPAATASRRPQARWTRPQASTDVHRRPQASTGEVDTATGELDMSTGVHRRGGHVHRRPQARWTRPQASTGVHRRPQASTSVHKRGGADRRRICSLCALLTL